VGTSLWRPRLRPGVASRDARNPEPPRAGRSRGGSSRRRFDVALTHTIIIVQSDPGSSLE
jgi:hypothetical protein